MNIDLIRIHRSSYSVDSVLKIGGLKVCDAAENAQTALPEGVYKIVIHKCKQYRRKMPVILLQPEELSLSSSLSLSQACENCEKLEYVSNNTNLPRYCPQIKIGNGVYNRTDGSIIIGERITWGAIAHPVQYFNRLIDRLDKAANRHEPITLTIQ